MDNEKKTQKRWALWANIATVIGVIIAGTALFFNLIGGNNSVKKEIDTAGKNITYAGKKSIMSRLQITYPLQDDVVGLTDTVRGYTPYGHRNHYLVVMPLETGGEWVQEGPLRIYEGVWAGRVKFGTAATSNGARFAIRVMATNASLREGLLTVQPEGSVFSDPVTVKLNR